MRTRQADSYFGKVQGINLGEGNQGKKYFGGGIIRQRITEHRSAQEPIRELRREKLESADEAEVKKAGTRS